MDFEPAMSAVDAAIIQWKLAAKKRHLVVTAAVRDTLYMVYLNDIDQLESAGWGMRSYLEQWALGNIPTREFRYYVAWEGAAWPWRQRKIDMAWDLLRESTQKRQRPDYTEAEKDIAALDARALRRPFAERIDKLYDRIFKWRYRR